MKRLLSKQAKRIYLILILVFLVLFLFRLGYGYTLKINDQPHETISFDRFSDDNKKNYASDGYEMDKGGLYEEQPSSSVDQKYEKIAEVQAESSEFDQDERRIRSVIKDNFGIIQYERKTGNDGQRRLQLQVGVPPENFDTLYGFLIGIGYTHSKEIIKNDKTNAYLELNARKASLEKTLASLIQFKEKNGQIDEFINLENRILEIQEKLQQLGVNLGDFDESNAFCTIQFSLAEVKKKAEATISFYHRVKVALEWTIRQYLAFISIVFFAVLSTYLLLLIMDKRHLLFPSNTAKNKTSEKE